MWSFSCPVPRLQKRSSRLLATDRGAAHQLLACYRGHDSLYYAVHCRRLIPVPDEDNIVVRVDPDDIRAIADGGEAGGWAAGPLFLLSVQPPEIAIIRTVLARCNRVLEPLLGNYLATVPSAMVEDQQPKAREILGVDPQPAAPARAARDGFDLAAVDIHLRVVIAHPSPVLRSADLVHDVSF